MTATPTRDHRPELVHLDVADGVATVTLDSPANRNALSAQLRQELLDRLGAALSDDRVRVVVLTHNGAVFCAGADLKEARSGGGAGPGDEFLTVLELLWTSPKPVVARLAGPARAGGVGLVAACDLAVATASVTFAFTEVRIGVVPAIISVPLRHRVLPHALHRLFLTGETFSARRAYDIGLLSEVSFDEDLDEQVREIVDALLLGAPQAMAGTKQLLHERTPSIAGDLKTMQQLSSRYFRSSEAQEGMRAFADKRPAVWVPVPTTAAPGRA